MQVVGMKLLYTVEKFQVEMPYITVANLRKLIMLVMIEKINNMHHCGTIGLAMIMV